MSHVIGIGLPYGGDWIVIGIVAVILFGKRLPEVGRSLGKGIIEFKKGLRGIEEDVEQGVKTPSDQTQMPTPSQPALPPGSKFDPVTGQPLVANQSEPTIARETPKPQYRFDPYTGQPLAAQKE
jgi:sec-independent protein translocase protein TatA